MACSACGNKARRPIRSTVGTPPAPAPTERKGGENNRGSERIRGRISGLRWNNK